MDMNYRTEYYSGNKAKENFSFEAGGGKEAGSKKQGREGGE